MHAAKLIVKNAFRHKLRTFLTLLGMAIAILAFCLLRTVVSAWYAGVEASSASRLVTRNAVSLVFYLPLSYKEKIRQVEGVKAVSFGNWFGGIYIDEKHFIPNFAVDGASYLEMFPEFILDPGQKAAFLRDRKGVVAGRIQAEKYGWKIGDSITLKGTIFPGNWEFTLRGIYRGKDKGTDESQFFFHYDYLNESLKKTRPQRADQAGFYMISIRNPEQAAEVSRKVDALFKNSMAETLTETERAFNLSFIAMTDAIVIAIQLISFVIIIIIMAVVANTMAMTARERIGEYAIFKALGFKGWHLAGLIFGESLVISMTGAAAGVLLTFPAANAFSEKLGSFFPVFNVSPNTIVMAVVSAFVVGCVAGLVPTWRAIRIRIADGLRRVG